MASSLHVFSRFQNLSLLLIFAVLLQEKVKTLFAVFGRSASRITLPLALKRPLAVLKTSDKPFLDTDLSRANDIYVMTACEQTNPIRDLDLQPRKEEKRIRCHQAVLFVSINLPLVFLPSLQFLFSLQFFVPRNLFPSLTILLRSPLNFLFPSL